MWTDTSVVFWRHYRAFADSMKLQVATFAVLVTIGGLAVPLVLLSGVSQLASFSNLIDLANFLICVFFAGIISSESFYAERVHHTLPAVLASPLRPVCLFIGKWAWFMLATCVVLFAVTLLSRVVVLMYMNSSWSTSEDYWFTVMMFAFTLGSTSWIIAANSVLSLVIRDPKAAQMMGSLATLVPFILGLVIVRFAGMKLGLPAMGVVGGICVGLAVLSFFAAIQAFRSEFVRL
jgi:hypothetical protein